MTDETRTDQRSDTHASSQKRPWTTPRIEAIKGRDAEGSTFSSGGPDGGFYS